MDIRPTLLTAMILFDTSIACSAGAQSSTPPAKTKQLGTTIVQDGQVNVRYRSNGPLIQFSSELPAGWSFTVAVDGDQNGVWGVGSSQETSDRSPDFKIGQDSENGIFCGQYILTASATDPTQVFSSTDCDGFPSGGTVTMSQMTQKKSAEITYQIPTSVMFGKNNTIKLQICVWDTQRNKCYFSPQIPYSIKRPAENSDE